MMLCFYASVEEDTGKPQIISEGMEISTRSRGKDAVS